MKGNTSTCSSRKFAKHSEPPDILGEFQVDNYRFLILNLENSLDNNSLSSLPAYQASSYTELGRFEVQGHLCAIVKIEQHFSPLEIDLATLLTERELQIATLVASGRSNKQIASQLHISEWTVSTHLRRTFIKLGVDSRAAMVYRCASSIQQLSG